MRCTLWQPEVRARATNQINVHPRRRIGVSALRSASVSQRCAPRGCLDVARRVWQRGEVASDWAGEIAGRTKSTGVERD